MRANEDALARGGALRLAVEVRRRYDAMRFETTKGCAATWNE